MSAGSSSTAGGSSRVRQVGRPRRRCPDEPSTAQPIAGRRALPAAAAVHRGEEPRHRAVVADVQHPVRGRPAAAEQAQPEPGRPERLVGHGQRPAHLLHRGRAQHRAGPGRPPPGRPGTPPSGPCPRRYSTAGGRCQTAPGRSPVPGGRGRSTRRPGNRPRPVVRLRAGVGQRQRAEDRGRPAPRAQVAARSRPGQVAEQGIAEVGVVEPAGRRQYPLGPVQLGEQPVGRSGRPGCPTRRRTARAAGRRCATAAGARSVRRARGRPGACRSGRPGPAGRRRGRAGPARR